MINLQENVPTLLQMRTPNGSEQATLQMLTQYNLVDSDTYASVCHGLNTPCIGVAWALGLWQWTENKTL